MSIEPTTHHGLDLDASRHQYVQAKAETRLKTFNQLLKIDHVLDHQNSGRWWERHGSAEGSHDFEAWADAPGLEVVTDQVVHLIEHQIRRDKDRSQDHRHRAEGPQEGTSPSRSDLPEPSEWSEPPRGG